MDRFNNIDFGGFKVSGSTLMKVDEMIGQVADFAAKSNGDNYISSGVEAVGNGNYSDGYIVWQGEILPFQGGAFTDEVTIIEEVFTATYQDGQNKGYYKRRYARFGNNGVTTFKFSDLKPVYANFAKQYLNAVLLPYTGLLTDIPKGFSIADGTNGKPNAGGRVFQAIGTGEGQDEIGTVGGSKTIVIEQGNLPSIDLGFSLKTSGSSDMGYIGVQGDGNPDGSKDTISVGDANSYPRKTKLFKIPEAVVKGSISLGGSNNAINIEQPFIKGAYITWVGF